MESHVREAARARDIVPISARAAGQASRLVITVHSNVRHKWSKPLSGSQAPTLQTCWPVGLVLFERIQLNKSGFTTLKAVKWRMAPRARCRSFFCDDWGRRYTV